MNISIADAHNRLSKWLKQLHQGPITLTRRGKPVGVIIDPAEYERLRQVQAYIQMLNLAQDLQASNLTARELREGSRKELEERS